MRFATPRILVIGLALLAVLPMEARGGSGPGRNIWPARGTIDAQLYAKAMRIQARMWWHLSPEGLLVETHRPGATPAQLSHDVLGLGDTAIWTGCYAASQACRWHVTKDPDALAQLRVLAKGLRLLSDVTGVPGRLTRTVGRPLPGERRKRKTVPSTQGDGLHFVPDVSRDQLAGVTLGWFSIWKFASDVPELQNLATRSMTDIAERLGKDRLWLRDWKGRKTEHGELTTKVPSSPIGTNGCWASIGLAAAVAAYEMDPTRKSVRLLLKHLILSGWDEAVSSQNTFFSSLLRNSNVNMTAISLLVLRLATHKSSSYFARGGMQTLRGATRGWWNAGICSCWLLGRIRQDQKATLGEIRATLHGMPEGESPLRGTQTWEEDKIVPIQFRTLPSGWVWKDDPWRRFHAPAGAPPSTKVTHTRADFLFAYWLARAAGAIRPKVGPGANAKAHRCAVAYPPWMQGRSVPSSGRGATR